MRTVARWAAVAALVVLASGCGARLSEEDLAAAGSTPGGAAGGGPVAGGPRTADGQAATATTASGAAPGDPSAAPADQPGAPAAGPGGDSGGGEQATTCSPQPVDEVGVTDTEIRLGNVSTISGPIPGLGQTSLNGARAYIAYVNSQGGVCGRQLRLLTGDDRLDAGQNRAEAQRLSREVLGFTGSFTVVDGGLASVLDGTNIASTALAVSDPAIASPNMFSPSPIDPAGGTQGTAPMWDWFRRTSGITKVAIVYPAQADARARGLAYRADIEAAGLTVDGPYEVAITETNYVGVAQQIENNGADAVITALEVSGMARLAQAFEQIGYLPKVPYYGAQAYGQQFLDLAGSAAEGTRIGVQYAILEDAGANPTVATFLEWYERTARGSKPDFFAIMGWAAADMMVQALRAAGPAPTRDAVLGFLRGLHEFDAHGLVAPCDPAGKRASPQFAIATVRDGRWVREYPAAGFATS